MQTKSTEYLLGYSRVMHTKGRQETF